MKISDVKLLKTNLIKTSLGQCIPHIIFFWLRNLSFAAIKMSTHDVIPRMHLVRNSVNDMLYLTQLNLCQLHISLDSLIHANIMKYRLTTVLSLHNAVLCMFIATFTFRPQLKYWILISILTLISLGEGLYSIYISYSKRYEFEFELFKKVGIDQKINSAYVTRKSLESIYGVTFFANCAIAGRFIYNPLQIISSISYAVLVWLAISLAQQLFVCVRFNSEVVLQRKIAIVLSAVKMAASVLILVYYRWQYRDSWSKGMAVDILLFCDSIVLSILEGYYVFIDWRKFGSGLKKRLAFNTTRLILGNPCV